MTVEQKYVVPPRTTDGHEIRRWFQEIAQYINRYLTINQRGGEPTGFIDTTATLSWSDGSLALTITGAHSFYQSGVLYNRGTTTKALSADTSGIHYYYYSNGVLSTSMTWPGFNVPLVAIVYWNTTTNKGLLTEERHGFVMDGATHAWMHNTVGPRYVSGLVGTFTNTTFSMTAGSIYDEDLAISIGAATTCNILYKNGSSDWAWDAAQTNYMKMNGANVRYNNGTALADASSNNYVAYWFFATNDATTPIWVIMGQRQDTTIANARANNTYESLSLGTLPSKEMKLLYRVIVRNDATPYEEAQDLRQVSNIPAGTYIAPDHGMLAGLADDDHTQYLLRTDVSNSMARAYLGAAQTGKASGAEAQVLFDTEAFDLGGNFASNKYTVPAGGDGYYHVDWSVYMEQEAASVLTSGIADLNKNATTSAGAVNYGTYHAASSNGGLVSNGSCLIYLVATDYLTVSVIGYTSSGTWKLPAASQTFMSVYLVAKA